MFWSNQLNSVMVRLSYSTPDPCSSPSWDSVLEVVHWCRGCQKATYGSNDNRLEDREKNRVDGLPFWSSVSSSPAIIYFLSQGDGDSCTTILTKKILMYHFGKFTSVGILLSGAYITLYKVTCGIAAIMKWGKTNGIYLVVSLSNTCNSKNAI